MLAVTVHNTCVVYLIIVLVCCDRLTFSSNYHILTVKDLSVCSDPCIGRGGVKSNNTCHLKVKPHPPSSSAICILYMYSHLRWLGYQAVFTLILVLFCLHLFLVCSHLKWEYKRKHCLVEGKPADKQLRGLVVATDLR